METITFIFSLGKLLFWLSEPNSEKVGILAFSELFGEKEANELGKKVQEAICTTKKQVGNLYISKIELQKSQIEKFKEAGSNSPIYIETREDTICARLVYPRIMD